MTSDLFLKVDGIQGESTDDKHKNEIDIHSYHFTVSNEASFTKGGPGGGAGRSSASALRVTKPVDAASPGLIKACCTGQHIDELTLTVRKAGGTPLDYATYTMKPAFVTKVTPTAGKGGSDIIEIVEFVFGELHVDYDTQDSKGNKGDHFAMGYSFSKNATV